MAKKSTTARPRREAKYFTLEDLEVGAAWQVYKKKKGFYLWAGESGEVNGPYTTISGALNWGAIQYGAEYAVIDTNVQLEELLEIMNAHNFEPLLHNLSS